MRLDAEARRTEERIRGARPVKNVPELKAILRQGLGGFEKSLEDLSDHGREAAMVLYLNTIRRITYGYHSAVLRQAARGKFAKNPTRATMQEVTAEFDKELERITRLYRFL